MERWGASEKRLFFFLLLSTSLYRCSRRVENQMWDQSGCVAKWIADTFACVYLLFDARGARALIICIESNGTTWHNYDRKLIETWTRRIWKRKLWSIQWNNPKPAENHPELIRHVYRMESASGWRQAMWICLWLCVACVLFETRCVSHSHFDSYPNLCDSYVYTTLSHTPIISRIIVCVSSILSCRSIKFT